MSRTSTPGDADSPQGPERHPLHVIVTVSGGVADVLVKPEGIAVTLLDYDVDGADEGHPCIIRDPDGQLFCVRKWDASTEVLPRQDWPIVKEAAEGSYARTWQCPNCGRSILVTYEELAEVGCPLCGDCDDEMTLL